MFQRWFGHREDPREEAAQALYGAIVGQARQVEFYRDCGVPDTVDGRFEMVLLHVFLVLRRLRQAAESGETSGAESASAAEGPAGDLSQRLFDTLFRDMDASLREMGVGDLSVGKKIKDMVEAFYGRVSSYETGLEAGGAALEAALERNLLGTAEATREQIVALSGYVAAAADDLDGQALVSLLEGQVSFAAPPHMELIN